MTQSPSPFDPRTVYSLSDPALEKHTEEQEAEYRRTLDVSLLRIRPGMTPVKIVVRPADAMLVMNHLTEATPDARILALRACVESITLPNGERLEPKHRVHFAKVEIASEDWVRTLFQALGGYRVTELAFLCVNLSNLGQRSLDPLSQWGGQLPPS